MTIDELTDNLIEAMGMAAAAIGTHFASEPNDLKVRHQMCKIQNELDDFCEWDPDFQGSWFTSAIDTTLDLADLVRNNLRKGL